MWSSSSFHGSKREKEEIGKGREEEDERMRERRGNENNVRALDPHLVNHLWPGERECVNYLCGQNDSCKNIGPKVWPNCTKF